MKPLDVVVIGGGIAGLWTLAALRNAGYQAVLLERQALGTGQTLASQGIIHGGTKYALTGKLTGSSEAVRSMPQRWKQHLAAELIPDLSACRVNTPHQWMWDAGGVSSRISSFFASKLMSSRVQSLAVDQRPGFLRDKTIYQLQEPVIDVKSVLTILTEQNQQAVFHAQVMRLDQKADHVEVKLRVENEEQTLQAMAAVFCAGTGNEPLQAQPMQRRPLQMVMVKGDLPELWGHVIEANANPRMTITSHLDKQGEVVWYIGGQLAEEGAKADGHAVIQRAKQDLQSMFPAIDWSSKRWATLAIDRAEGQQPGNKRPDDPVIKQDGRTITVWPTKLVFAPLVADEVLGMMSRLSVQPTGAEVGYPDLPSVEVGEYPWDEADWQS